MTKRLLPYLGAAVLGAIMLGGAGGSGCVYYLNPLCTDQIHNGAETDIDCGGICGPCNIGDSCSVGGDCYESNCVGGTCTPFPCDNGIKSEQETDVDCGGGSCRKCAGARKCQVASDCFSGTCDPDNTCASLATVSFADAVAYASGSKTYVLLSGDLDGDGDIDLAACDEQGSAISVFLNNGAGTFQGLAAAFPTGEYPTGGVVADFNHDGIPDIVTADYHGNSISVLLGTGTGAFAPKTTYPTVAASETSNLAVGDLDGDTNPDVIATNPATSSVSQFMGRADGTFEPGITVPVGIMGSSAPYSVAIGDFDGNGFKDMAIADVVSRTIIVRLGNGDGTFQPEIPYAEGGFGPYIITAADLNVDGKLDLAVANRGGNNVSVLVGRGDGTFKKPVLSSTGAGTGPYSIAVADFNRDGVPDVVTPNYQNSTASVLLGIGDGTFEPPINAGATGSVSYGVTAGDFNGDLKPDFATANAVSNNVTVKLSVAQ